LPRSQCFRGSFLNAIVVKNKPVQHVPILSRGAMRPGRTDHRRWWSVIARWNRWWPISEM
jgi:hypothetical protein